MTILEAIQQHKVVWCKTKKESDRILLILHNMGVKYTGKLDLLENDYWGQYKEETCYNLERVALAIDKAIPDSYHGVTYEDRYYFEKTYPQFKAKVIASTKIK